MWPALARRARPHAWPAATGLALGLLALGPALGRGFVLTYDMVFVPDPPISSADLGLTGGPARAVPSDLIVALAARIIPAEFVQKLILLAIFVLACAGAAALLAARWPERPGGGRLPLLAQLVAGVCYAWNPFVAERLIMGQWAMLLGYAGLPWVLRELCGLQERIRPGRLVAAMVPAAVGGFAAMSITALAAVPAALCGGRTWPDRARRIALTLGIIVVASLPWVIPSLAVPVHADPNGAAAFAARADTPFGVAGSLLMLSGIWNAQAVPAGYGGPASACWLVVVVLALAGYLIAARPRRISPGLGVAAAAGFCIAALGLSAATLSALYAAISFSPSFALLRDSQQFLAPLALAESIGLGAGVAAMIAAARAAYEERGPYNHAAAGQPARSQAAVGQAAGGQAAVRHTAVGQAAGGQAAGGQAAGGQGAGAQAAGGQGAGSVARNLVKADGALADRPQAGGADRPRADDPHSERLRADRPSADQADRPQADRRSGGRAPASASAVGPAVTLGVIALLAPVLLLPGLAWGAVGRLQAVQYPADWLRARQIIQTDRHPGSVLLLPWAQYRRYSWNHGEAVFDPWPRFLARPMIWNDALQVGATIIAAESQSARRLGPVITSARPLTPALLASGVRYVVVDAGPLLGQRRGRLAELARLPGAQVVLASSDLIVFRLAATPTGRYGG